MVLVVEYQPNSTHTLENTPAGLSIVSSFANGIMRAKWLQKDIIIVAVPNHRYNSQEPLFHCLSSLSLCLPVSVLFSAWSYSEGTRRGTYSFVCLLDVFASGKRFAVEAFGGWVKQYHASQHTGRDRADAGIGKDSDTGSDRDKPQRQRLEPDRNVD